jgi:hypothetical protein
MFTEPLPNNGRLFLLNSSRLVRKDTLAQRRQGYLLLVFLQNKESGLKRELGIEYQFYLSLRHLFETHVDIHGRVFNFCSFTTELKVLNIGFHGDLFNSLELLLTDKRTDKHGEDNTQFCNYLLRTYQKDSNIAQILIKKINFLGGFNSVYSDRSLPTFRRFIPSVFEV